MANSRAAACVGKKAYATHAKASRVVQRTSRREKGEILEVYRCKGCGAYHIGGQFYRTVARKTHGHKTVRIWG